MDAPQLTIDGREERRSVPQPAYTQPGLFDVAPASTFAFDEPAPALVPGQLDVDARTHEPMRPRAGIRHSGEWS